MRIGKGELDKERVNENRKEYMRKRVMTIRVNESNKE